MVHPHGQFGIFATKKNSLHWPWLNADIRVHPNAPFFEGSSSRIVTHLWFYMSTFLISYIISLTATHEFHPHAEGAVIVLAVAVLEIP